MPQRRSLLSRRNAVAGALALFAALGGGRRTLAQSAPATTPAPTWEALRARPYPEWFRDAKLGIFVHWGVYSVPAYGGKESYAEWYLRGLQTGDTLRTRFMRERYGPGFTYRDFAPLFKAELFDPAEWAGLFKRSGARYVVLTAKHHDGYALWPSRYAPGWNSVDVGPRRDLVGDLTRAVRAAGLRMGLYYSLPEWNNALHRWGTDAPNTIAPYVERHMVPQFEELIAAYRPTVLFTDGEWDHPAETWHARELIARYYDLVGPEAIVNDRWGRGSDVGFLTPEYSSGLPATDRPWAEVRGLGRSFGLNRNEPLEAYMTPEELVHFFARAVAAGGGMILNVGPAADGQIPLLQQERLLQLGTWLATNGEAVYGTRPWRKTGEERDVTLQRVDSTVDFDWVRNSPGRPIREDHYTATWTGYVQPRHTGSYHFEVEADDGARVWIGDTLVVDRWGDSTAGAAGQVMDRAAPRAAGGTMRLVAGRKYPIRIAYHETVQNARMRFFWSPPGRPRAVVPRAALFTARDRAEGDGLRATYRSTQTSLVYTRKGADVYAITFEWPDRELALPVAAPPPGTRVTLLGREERGALPWRHANGVLYVDLSGVPYRLIPGRWAWTVKLAGYDPGTAGR